MKVLVVGSGGREDAIVWKLARSEKVSEIFVAPGNGGTELEEKAKNIAIQADDIDGLKDFALANKINLTVVGPEIPLSMGIVDKFAKHGLKIFGPVKNAAFLEASKAFAKEIMVASGVPTAAYEKFNDIKSAKDYINAKGAPLVVKADGLAAGKGVTVAMNLDDALNAVEDILVKKVFGESTVVIEEFLDGIEISYLALTDGKTILPLAPAQDHKAVFDGDKGPNTGGMGAYSPAYLFTDEQYAKVADMVIKPVVDELAKRGIPYNGVLYAGLMVKPHADGSFPDVKVLEYNCRFGDPETQVILPRLKNDLFDVMIAVIDSKLEKGMLNWAEESCATVVMASKGYPDSYPKGIEIKGIESANKIDDVRVFHAGTVVKDGKLVTSGGRVLNVTAQGKSLEEALSKAYEAVSKINFDGAHYRKDIGAKASK